MMLHCCQYGIVVTAYFPLELNKHIDATVLSPFDPSVQFFLGDSDILALENIGSKLPGSLTPIYKDNFNISA